MKKKQALKHKLLNTLTAMNYFLAKRTLSQKERTELKKLNNIASLLVEHEDLFLGEPVSFFIQEMSLQELLDNMNENNSKISEDQKITFKVPHNNPILHLDRYHVVQALQTLVGEIVKNSELITYTFDEASETLQIQHQSTAFSLPSEPSLIASLSKKNIPNDELILHVSIEMLKRFGIEITLEPTAIHLQFPQKKPHPHSRM